MTDKFDLPCSEQTLDISRVLLDRLVAAGYERVEPPILQDASHFLDLGGEEIRASLYFTSDRSGAELCLRPEYTIPICRAYLSAAGAGRPASFSSCGPVFRSSNAGPGEVIQASLESFGREDSAEADADVLSVALSAAEAAGSGPLSVRFGDAALLSAVFDALQLPPTWQRRVKRGLDKGESLGKILETAPGRPGDHSGVLAALAGANTADARALVDDLLAIAGIETVGGRSADEIADRYLTQVALRAAPAFSAERRVVLEQVFAVNGHPDAAASALRSLAADAQVDLGGALDAFENRNRAMATRNIDLNRLTFQGSFGRNLDYYTGFVFEARHPTVEAGPLIGGGRYDRLAQALGHPDPISAVGAAIWPDRIRSAAEMRS